MRLRGCRGCTARLLVGVGPLEAHLGKNYPGPDRVLSDQIWLISSLQGNHLKVEGEKHNEKGSKVEADVAMCLLLSLFRREENRDGDTYVPYALHNY